MIPDLAKHQPSRPEARLGAVFLRGHREKQDPLGSMHILVVDDKSQMRDAIRTMLRANGYHSLHIAESGKCALGEIGNHLIKIIIADWNMPNMPGIELVKRVKNDPKYFTIPVLMISNEMTKDRVLYAVEEGVDSLLMMPFSEEGLLKHVKPVLHKVTQSNEIEQQILDMRRLTLSKDYKGALELGRKILKTRNHPRVLLMTSKCLFHIKEYDTAMNTMLDSDEATRTSEHTNLLGKIYMKLGKHDQGLLHLEEAAKKNILNHDRKIDLAQAYMSVGRVQEAGRVADEVVNSNATDLNLVDLAQLYLDLGEIDKAGSYLNQTVDPIPETVNVFNNYAVALRKANRFEESLKVYKRCLEIAPDSDVLYYNLGFLLTSCGKYTEARSVLQKAIRLNPEDQYTRSLLEKVSLKLR
jgi:two-component system, chemotaxis family, chemotaxis protein CheY